MSPSSTQFPKDLKISTGKGNTAHQTQGVAFVWGDIQQDRALHLGKGYIQRYYKIMKGLGKWTREITFYFLSHSVKELPKKLSVFKADFFIQCATKSQNSLRHDILKVRGKKGSKKGIRQLHRRQGPQRVLNILLQIKRPKPQTTSLNGTRSACTVRKDNHVPAPFPFFSSL